MIGHRVHELSTWVGNSFSSLTVQGVAKKQQLRKLLFMLLLEKSHITCLFYMLDERSILKIHIPAGVLKNVPPETMEDKFSRKAEAMSK